MAKNLISDPILSHDDEIDFVVWLTGERRSALFPAGPQRQSPTRREHGLILRRTWVQTQLNEVVQKW